MSNAFLTPQQVAELMEVNVVTIRRYIKSGKLHAVLMGKEYRVGIDDYKKFLLDNGGKLVYRKAKE